MENYQLDVLVPGPVPVSPEVLAAMGRPVPVHYGPTFVPFYNGLIEHLKQIFGTSSPVFPMGGSGTAGVEAALSTLMGMEKRAAVVTNGTFGERLVTIARGYDPEAQALEVEWGQAADPAEVGAFLGKHRVDVLAVVQSETSTGVANPIKELATVAREHDVALMVDGVGSVGGMPLCLDEWGIAACATASQKCLEAPPGLGIAALSADGWKLADSVKRPAPGFYLNLNNWRKWAEESKEWHPYPVTVATNNLMALDQSAQRILAEGLEARFERHRRTAAYLRSALRALDFRLLAEDDAASPTVTVAFPPEGVDAAKLMTTLRQEYGMIVGGGLGKLGGKVIRVGHLGSSANEGLMKRLIAALEAALKSAR
ncbi:MAG TPA: alanine--glyoxylate aminotransferase family protein [Ktedonobacterales bacterium]|nr:alanine--glyoxylate aminotransferase family protein [Ktedonobacterales bacterium]